MDNELAFSVQARAELLAMFTGMALQGILSNPNHSTLGKSVIASEAVDAADAAVSALEAFHQAAARRAEQAAVTEETGDVGSTAQ